jgi:hypothetical protein
VEAQPLTAAVARFTPADPNAQAGDFTSLITWGDGTTSPGTVTPTSDGGFTVSGTHTYTEEGIPPLQVLIQASDGSSATATPEAGVGDAPLAATGYALTARQGQPLTGVVATFTDDDLGARATDFTAFVNWDDGQSTRGQIRAHADGTFDVLATRLVNQESEPVDYQVLIQDAGGAFTTAGGSVSTRARPSAALPFLSAEEGQPVTGVVAHFSAAGRAAKARDLTAVIHWGDGQTSEGTVQAAKGGGFDVLGTHTYDEEGLHIVQVRITDGHSRTVSAAGQVGVADAPLDAVAHSFVAVEGQPWTRAEASFTDADSSATASDFTAFINWDDGHTAVAQVTANGRGGFDVTAVKTYPEEADAVPFQVLIRDKGGSFVEADGTAGGVDAPLNLSVSTPTFFEGASLTGSVATFRDPNVNAIASEFTAVIDWGDGHTSAGTVTKTGVNTISGSFFAVSGSHTYAEESTPTVKVTINDLGGSSATASAAAKVNDANVTITLKDPGAVEGRALNNAVVATFTDADPGATAGDYLALISWGDGTTADQNGTVVADPHTAGVFDVVGSHTYAEEGPIPHFEVQAIDTGGAAEGLVTAINVADAPLTASGVNIAPVEATQFTGQVATFTDADPAATTSDYTSTINWGDGQTSTGTIGVGPGVFTVTGTHTYAEGGTDVIQTTIHDAVSSALALSGVNVTDLGGTAPQLKATENVALPAGTLMATFIDPDAVKAGSAGDPDGNGTIFNYSATIDWGDGHTSAGSINSPSMGVFNVLGVHTYAEAGSDPVSVKVTDLTNGLITTFTSTAVVADGPLVSFGISSIKGTEGVALPASTVLATFSDADDPGASAADYSARIDFDVGHAVIPFSGTIQPVSGGFQVIAGIPLTYTEAGTHTLAVTITDLAFGTRTVAKSTATIADAALTLSGVTLTGTESVAIPSSTVVATFTDADTAETAGAYSASIAWGDGQVSTGTIQNTGPGKFQVLGGHTYTDAGLKFAQVTVTDLDGSTVGTTVGVLVSDLPLKLSSSSPNGFTMTEGAASTLVVANFTDADPNATALDYSVTIDWGDGSTSVGAIQFNLFVNPGGEGGPILTSGSFSVTGTHTYMEEGANTVTVKVSEKDNFASLVSVPIPVTINDAPVTVTGEQFSGAATKSTGKIKLAAFTDANPNATASDFVATISWADGTSDASNTTSSDPANPVTVVADPKGNGVFDVFGSHTYGSQGNFSVSVGITSDNGTSGGAGLAHGIITALIQGTNLPVSVTENEQFTLPVAALDALSPGSVVTATIDWGDHTTSAGMPNPDNTLIIGTHTYTNDEGNSNKVTVTVTETNGTLKTTKTFTPAGPVTVVDPPLTNLTPLTVHAVKNVALSGVEVASFVDPGNATGGTEPLGDFRATIDWGDGSPSAPADGSAVTIKPDGSGALGVFGSHTYTSDGIFPITVTITPPPGSPPAVTIKSTTDGAVNLSPLHSYLDNQLGGTSGLQQLLDRQVSASDLPLIGKALNSVPDVNSLVTSLQSKIDGVFSSLGSGPNLTAANLQNALLAALGPTGLNVLASDPNPITISTQPGQATFELKLHKDIVNKSVPINLDLGLPGLGLKFNPGSTIKVGVGFDADLIVGVKDNPAPTPFLSPSTFKVNVSVTTPNLDVQGTLGFFQVDAKDGNSVNDDSPPEPVSSFNATFPLNLSTDGGGNLQVTDTLTAAANINLELTASINGSNAFPSVTADLGIQWNFNSATPGSQGDAPTVTFSEVQVNLGTFLTSFVGPILQDVQDVALPLQGLAEFLTQPVPVVSNISTTFGNDPVTFGSLLAKFANIDPSTIATFANAILAIDQIPAADLAAGKIPVYSTDPNTGIVSLLPSVNANPNSMLNLGGFTVSDPRSAVATVADMSAAQNDAEQQDPTAASFFNQIGSFGFSFPILEQPQTLFNLLLGQPGDPANPPTLFQVNVPGVSIAVPTFNVSFPIPVLLDLVSLNFGAGFNLTVAPMSFGYDLRGLEEATPKPLDGFFVQVQNPSISLSVTVNVGVSLGTRFIAALDGNATLTASFGLNLTDSKDPSNPQRIYLSDIGSTQVTPSFSFTGTISLAGDLFDNTVFVLTLGGIKFDPVNGITFIGPSC